MYRFLLFGLLLLLPLASAIAADDEAARASELFFAGKYAEAKPIYASFAAKNEKAPINWMRLAFCQLQTGEPKAAVESYERAIARGGAEGYARYNMACAYARLKDKEQALTQLEKAAALNFGRAYLLEQDEDFAGLRAEKRFKDLVEKMKEPTKGMKGAEAMDLWVGEWDVFTSGNLAGHNLITKTLDGFAVEEHWTSRGGGKGQSFFTFNPANGTWHQLWIDDRGWTIDKIGTPIENGIRFEGWSFNADGTKQRARTTLSKNPDGSVRQLIEMEEKDGTWSAAFDGKYVKKTKYEKR